MLSGGVSEEPQGAAAPEEPDDEHLVPPADERQWLLARLGELTRRFGAARLVVGPLPHADETWFPDRWAGGEPSMRRLVRRLVIYAGMDDVPVSVKVHDDGQDGGGGGTTFAPVWFVGAAGGTLQFGALASALRTPLLVVPAAARAVAEGFLRTNGVKVGEEPGPQRIVDVAAHFLGFGLMTTDAAIRHVAGAQAGFRGSRQKLRLGVLAPQSQAFLLGASAVARQMSNAEVRRLARKMQPNPAAFFRAARDRLSAADPSLAQTLAIAPRDKWPDPPDLDELRAPFDDEDDDEEEGAEPEERKDLDRGVLGMNEGKSVFRVERSKALRLAKMLALPVVLLGILAGRMNMGIDIPMWQIAIAAATLGLGGLAVGRLLPDARCSEPKCGTPLAPGVEVCPRCGGRIAGVIGHPKERLAAEEALAQRVEAEAESGSASRPESEGDAA